MTGAVDRTPRSRRGNPNNPRTPPVRAVRGPCSEDPERAGLVWLGWGGSDGMGHSPEVFREQGDICPSLFPGQRHDIVFTPVVVIREVMYLTIEQRTTCVAFTQQEAHEIKRHGKLPRTLWTVRPEGQVDVRCGLFHMAR